MKKSFKQLYNFIPFKKELYTLIKLFWSPPKTIYQHFHFKGIFKVKIDKKHHFLLRHYGFEIENDIFWKGITNGWEKISIGLWIELCKQSEVILDIGANTGIYGLVAKAVKPSSKVYAFEPVKRVFQKLCANAELNKYDIVCIEKAVSNFNGQATIYDLPGEHVLSVTVNKNIHEINQKVIPTQIETITLSSVISNYNIPKIDLIKIDVETHEAEVLEGAGVFLEKYKPSLLIEILNDEVGKQVEALTKNLNYLFFNIDENKGIRRVDKITRSDYYNYLLCSSEVARKLKLV